MKKKNNNLILKTKSIYSENVFHHLKLYTTILYFIQNSMQCNDND